MFCYQNRQTVFFRDTQNSCRWQESRMFQATWQNSPEHILSSCVAQFLLRASSQLSIFGFHCQYSIIRIKAIKLSNMLFPWIKKTFHFYLRTSPPWPCDFWLASRMGRNVITCTYLFGVSYTCRPRGLKSNTFLDSSNCFVSLRKNSPPVSVVLDQGLT